MNLQYFARKPKQVGIIVKKSIRKLKRAELVELIYYLRRDNIDLRNRCKKLERQLHRSERMLNRQMASTDADAIGRIESMLEKLCADREGQA